MNRLLVVILASGIAASLPADTDGSRGARDAPALADPGYLPREARELLRRRMAHHAETSTRLLTAVLVLDRETARVLAGDIVSEPRLSRSNAGSLDTLNDRMPERFFANQDLLHERALVLQKAAQAKDDAALAAAFGRVTETCVTCHSAYLYGR